jgi:hypothetical protein
MRKSFPLGTLVVALLLAAGTAAAAPNNALKDMMKGMGAAAASDDLAGLKSKAAAIKAAKPNDPDYADWGSIADTLGGAADMTAAKATCKDCHNKYRDKYKTKYGSKAP